MRHCPTLVFLWLVLTSFVATECSAEARPNDTRQSTHPPIRFANRLYDIGSASSAHRRVSSSADANTPPPVIHQTKKSNDLKGEDAYLHPVVSTSSASKQPPRLTINFLGKASDFEEHHPSSFLIASVKVKRGRRQYPWRKEFWIRASYFEEHHRNFWVNASYSYSVEHHQSLFLVNQTAQPESNYGANVQAYLLCICVYGLLLTCVYGLLLTCLSVLLLPNAKLRPLKAQCSVKGGTKKLDKYSKEDYVKDPSLIGADPLQRTCPLVHKREAGQTDGRQLFSNLPNESNISKTLQEYANKCSDWCGWISGALPAFFDLPVTTQPPKDVVQAFLVGVDCPPILLTVCQNAKEAKKYASETASALTWRLLDFCHLDFLLLPCVVPNNFDLNDLKDEIKKQLQNLSWCHSGPKTLDKNTFPTMKAAANALARSTRVPDLLTTNNETEKMETLVMEEEWGDVLQGHIETWSGLAKESGGSLQRKLDCDVPFKEKVAAIEAMKRLSVRHSVKVVIPTPDRKLDDCIQRLRKEVDDRYNVSLLITVAPEDLVDLF